MAQTGFDRGEICENFSNSLFGTNMKSTSSRLLSNIIKIIFTFLLFADTLAMMVESTTNIVEAARQKLILFINLIYETWLLREPINKRLKERLRIICSTSISIQG